MYIPNSTKLTKKNYKKFLPIEDLVAFSWAEWGAMGCPGEVFLVTKSGKLYRFNTRFDDPALSESDINEIMPILQKWLDNKLTDWHSFQLGMGNHLEIHRSILDSFNRLAKDLINTPDLYSDWLKVVLKIIRHQKQPTYTSTRSIIGAIIGDIVGSRFEHYSGPIDMGFKLFTREDRYTDDTVMTIAIADWLLHNRDLAACLQEWGSRHPHRGYGGKFREWLKMPNPQPYNSFGNGSAMRVSPVGFFANSLEETLELAEKSAEVTHNHPEGIKGAQAIASAIYLARNGKAKEEIREYIEQIFGYDLHRTCDEIRPTYHFDVTCQGSCPEAIIAFLDSSDYESSIRLAVSLGGDSDTIACMTGGIAAAYYGVPNQLIEKALNYLSSDILRILNLFDCKQINN